MYTLDEQACIWLNSVTTIPTLKKYKSLELFESPHDMYLNLADKKAEVLEHVNESMYNDLIQAKETLPSLIDRLDELNIVAVTIYSDAYPGLLMEITPPPLVIYCKGRLELLKSNNIGVVGTRDCSRYGVETTEKFVVDLVKAGFTIVSGMARGIDYIAHNTALNLKADTIAVLASGLDIIYPPEHKELYRKIADKGLLVSEYIPGTPPNGFQFPERNRIISGLSSGVLVTEAGEKSGALITIDYALEQDREVFIVPGPITSRFCRGSNNRLKHVQGGLVTEVNDILYRLGMIADYEDEQEVTVMQLDFMEQKIIIELEKGEMHFDEILQMTGLSVPELNSLLTRMEICGIVKKNSGNYYEI